MGLFSHFSYIQISIPALNQMPWNQSKKRIFVAEFGVCQVGLCSKHRSQVSWQLCLLHSCSHKHNVWQSSHPHLVCKYLYPSLVNQQHGICTGRRQQIFEELIFCAARSQELCRKGSWWDCGITKQREQQWFLLLCNDAKGHGLSNVPLGIYGVLSLSPACKTGGALGLKYGGL